MICQARASARVVSFWQDYKWSNLSKFSWCDSPVQILDGRQKRVKIDFRGRCSTWDILQSWWQAHFVTFECCSQILWQAQHSWWSRVEFRGRRSTLEHDFAARWRVACRFRGKRKRSALESRFRARRGICDGRSCVLDSGLALELLGHGLDPEQSLLAMARVQLRQASASL